MKYINYIALVCCLVFFKESYSQKDTIIILEEIEQDYPLDITNNNLSDLDYLLRRSDLAQDSINLLFYSVDYFLKKDTCLDISLKKN